MFLLISVLILVFSLMTWVVNLWFMIRSWLGLNANIVMFDVIEVVMNECV